MIAPTYYATLTGAGYVDTWCRLSAADLADALGEARACLGGITEPRDLRISVAVRHQDGMTPLYSRGINGPWLHVSPELAAHLATVELEEGDQP